MLVVDPERRFTIDQCLSHPWLTQGSTNVNDSTGGLVGGIAGLEVNRRAPPRERTMLSNLNSVQVATTVDGNKSPLKVFSKNRHHVINAPKEEGPASQRAPAEFIEMGGKGDQQLFGDDSSSVYPSGEAAGKTKSRQKARANGR